MSNIKELKALQPTSTSTQKEYDVVQNPTINLSKTATKELYIVVTEDPTTKSKFRMYVTTKYSTSDAMIKFIGYEVTKNHSKVVSTLKNTNIVYADAIDIAKTYSEDLESLDLPWHRVIRVKTIKFAEK